MSPLPVWAHELAAPSAFLLAFRHVRRALGPSRAAVELGALALYGYALERVTLSVFASHRYSGDWAVAPGGVPVAVALVWAAVIASALALAGRLGLTSARDRAAVAALVGISLDLLMEPVAVRVGLWRWTPPGPWLGVPIGNFVGWAVIVGSYALGAELTASKGGWLEQGLRRVALGAASILALLAVGSAWKGLGGEGAFAAGRGWLAWAAVLGATLGVAQPRSRPGPSLGLAGSLGAAPGWEPGLVLLMLAGLFAADAVALAQPELALVALGSSLILAWLVWVTAPAAWGEEGRARAVARLASVRGLVRVLMKPRNRQAWTPEDRAFLRRALRELARWAPGFLLFLAPGGFFLLALYARLLDRRRVARPLT